MSSVLVPGTLPAPYSAAQLSSELPAFFHRIADIGGEFIIHDDGYRGWTWTYRDIADMAQSFRSRLRRSGLVKGDAVVIWSESRPGWIAALWASILEGIALVPVDPQSSINLFERISEKVQPRLILCGDRVPSIGPIAGAPVWKLSEIESASREAPSDPVSLTADDVAEIVFTSGTTAEPKGVIVTHRNLAANLSPIEDQIQPYLRYVHSFRPIRILNLLPMSHLFGQTMATFIPPLIPASVIFISSTAPQEIIRQIRRRRAAMLVAVPRALGILRTFLVHRFPAVARAADAVDEPWPLRWWRFRQVHRMFGWKFCCVVSGGAPLPADLEAFWSGLGYVVVQGYGLTETAPVVSFNHPFHIQRHTVGRPVAGVDVRIAPDGEILVRGDNVSPGYFHSPADTAEAYREGWLHTGDIGELTPDGNLAIKGRKKEMIVTPEGLNVFPEDVEAVLNGMPGVRDSAVFGENRVQAALVLEVGTDAGGVISKANEQLEDHQKIRSFSVWTFGELPRTASTGKLRHAEIAEAVRRGAAGTSAAPADVLSLLQKYAPGRVIHPGTRLDELGLSSLDRAELIMDIEEKLGTHIDESVFASARTFDDLLQPSPAVEPAEFPTWNRTWIARAARRAALGVIFLPLAKFVARSTKVSGRENLESLAGPVIFACNHQSYLDTPLILGSLPACRRYRIAPAMWKEYFDAYFHPDRHSRWEHWMNAVLFHLLALLFNAFPVPQTETGALESVRYSGELVEEGWSILIFPEGERTLTGAIGRFFPGVGMMASRLRIPVVPIRVVGVDRIWHRNEKWPRVFRTRSTHAAEVRFGAPVYPADQPYPAVADQVEQAVRRL
jgi:long-chain acyl-CoA synthetase